jgi:hypothetical protein
MRGLAMGWESIVRHGHRERGVTGLDTGNLGSNRIDGLHVAGDASGRSEAQHDQATQDC